MISAENVSMTYPNGTRALHDVTLTVPDGSVYSLLGANGAGKSTLMYLFVDFIRPTSGRTMVDGVVVQNDPVVARKRLAYLPDQVELFEGMSGLSNLSFFCRLAGHPMSEDGLLRLFDRVSLDHKWGREKVGRYSRGMRQKLGLAILLGRQSNSFLLDEPTLGLDPQSGWDLMQTIEELRASGASILMATHDLMRAQQVSDVIGIIRRGELVKEILRSEIDTVDLERTYLDQFEYDKSNR